MANHREVVRRLLALYREIASHDGYGDLRVEVRLLRRGQKEVILHCGRQYRYVVDHSLGQRPQAAVSARGMSTP